MRAIQNICNLMLGICVLLLGYYEQLTAPINCNLKQILEEK